MAFRILLVDDDPLIGVLVGEFLGEIGCEILGPATSVAAALRLIEGETPDAALIDAQLSDGYSWPVADALAARGVPFAFVTGHRAEQLPPAYRSAPALSKPFRLRELEAMKERLCTLSLRRV
jgi:DNA-binding response OmpR family regulator